MIEINLLPGAGHKRSSRRRAIDFSALTSGWSTRFRDKFLIAAIVGTVVSLGAVAALYFSQEHTASVLDERLASAVHDSTRYAQFLKARYKSEAVRDTLLRQVNVIRSIDDDRYVWPHVLDEVSRALPQYTWITVLSFAGTPQGSTNVVVTPKPPSDTSKNKNKPPPRIDTDVPHDSVSVRVMGQTVSIEALTRFMKDLANSPFLSNVVLDHSEIAIVNGKEVTQFQLTMAYTRPDSLYIHRVPLTLTSR